MSNKSLCRAQYISLSEEQIKRYYTNKDDKFPIRGGYRTHPLEAMKSFDTRENLNFPVKAPDGSEVWPKRQWRWGEETFTEAIRNDEVEFIKAKNGEWVLSSKQYLKDDNGDIRNTKPFTIIDDVFTQHGTNEIVDFFGNAKIFDFPKPSALIFKLLEIGFNSDRDGVFLDFFSGSGSTAQSIMKLNAEDGGLRKYVCVQLPESTPPDSEAFKAGYKNICEIGKERIRRAGDKILAEWQTKQQSGDLLADDTSSTALDVGFKVFKLDTSNVKPFDANNLFAEDLMVSGRSALDLWWLAKTEPVVKI